MGREKILAIKFKYLGDVALMAPALRMLRLHAPDAELHVLVAAEAAPLLNRLTWIDRVWALPRSRGKLRLRDSLPLIRELRAEKFNRSVDFVGNDRGALLSRMIGARERLGVVAPKGFVGRNRCYTKTIEELDTTRHETVRDAYVLSAWNVPFIRNALKLELTPDPDFATQAEQLMPTPRIIGHLSTSQRKKEWPVENWDRLADLLASAGQEIIFTAGPSKREQDLLKDLQAVDPSVHSLPKFDSLELFIATIARAPLFISPDTAPLHLAAALGVPTIGMFGPTASSRWAPLGTSHSSLQGDHCPCSGHLHECAQAERCLDAITPGQVFRAAMAQLERLPK
ncbi:MAG: glycosyltransferase family 9 protein [Puniceicoccales bacterium]